MASIEGRPTDEELLDVVSGRADDALAARVDAAAAEHPDIAADLALMRGARAALEPQEQAPGELGWRRLERELDGVQRSTPPSGVPRQRRGPWLQAVAASVAAVVLWQAVAVPNLPAGFLGTPGYETVSQQPTAGFVVTVAFAPGATETEIRTLLLEIEAVAVGGPSAIGLWQLGFTDEASREAGLTRLQSASVVERAQAE